MARKKNLAAFGNRRHRILRRDLDVNYKHELVSGGRNSREINSIVAQTPEPR